MVVAAVDRSEPGASASASPPTRFKYRPDIDGLRGIAVLAVVVFHLNKAWLPGGFTGVDIFFVISGYVVTGSMLNHVGEPLLPMLGNFYLRRIRRLLPNLLLCIGLTSVAVAALVPVAENGIYLITGVKSLFAWSNNFLLTSAANDYFGSEAETNPFLHTWSLAVEEQFYLVFPLLMAAFGLGRPRCLPWLSGAVLLSLGLSLLWTLQEPMRAFFLMPSRFWELSIGAVLLLLQRRGFARRWPAGRWLRLSGGLLLVLSLLFTSETDGFPVPGVFPAVIGTLLVLQAGPEADGRFLPFRWLERFLLACGLLSYSLYLWHWPVITLTRRMLGLELAWQYVFVCLLTLLLAIAAYLLVEQPVRRHPFAPPLQTLLAVVTLLGSWAGLDALFHHYRPKLYLGISNNPVPPHELIHLRDPVIAGTGINTKNCAVEAWSPYSESSRSDFNLCSKPGRPGAGEIFLIGDSHAQHFLPMLDQVSERTGQKISFSFKGACLFSPEIAVGLRGKIYEPCRQFSAGEMERSLQRLAPGDIVVASGFLHNYFNSDDPSGNSRSVPAYRDGQRVSAKEVRAGFIRGTRAFAERLASRGIQLVLIVDVPLLAREIIDCERWQPPFLGLDQGRSSCSRSPEETRRLQAVIQDVLAQSAAGLPNVHVFDPTPWLLDAGKGGRVRHRAADGRFLYWDSNHLTASGSLALADPFRAFLVQQRLVPATP